MTVTIDGKTLNVIGGGITESVKPVGTFLDKWINEEYWKKAKIIGTVRSWALECYEKNVAWNSSVAKHLEEKAKTGEAVSFSIDEGSLHSVASTKVYILGVDISYGKGAKSTQFIRYFTVSLQEAPP